MKFREASPPKNVFEVGIPDVLINFSMSGNPAMRLTTVRYPARESKRMEAPVRMVAIALYRRAAIVVVFVRVLEVRKQSLRYPQNARLQVCGSGDGMQDRDVPQYGSLEDSAAATRSRSERITRLERCQFQSD